MHHGARFQQLMHLDIVGIVTILLIWKYLRCIIQLVRCKHGQLAPTGWHVPTAAEWNTLTTFIGGTAGQVEF